ncbi:hypothetical protein HDU76_011551, partial [Blyttiomyces sp. JEL0837]
WCLGFKEAVRVNENGSNSANNPPTDNVPPSSSGTTPNLPDGATPINPTTNINISAPPLSVNPKLGFGNDSLRSLNTIDPEVDVLEEWSMDFPLDDFEVNANVALQKSQKRKKPTNSTDNNQQSNDNNEATNNLQQEDSQPRRFTSFKDGKVCVIQLALVCREEPLILLCQIHKDTESFPDKLRRILQHPKARFVGRSLISHDVTHLLGDWGVTFLLGNLVALENFCFEKGWVTTRTFSLDQLTRAVLGCSLDKVPGTRISNWRAKLSKEQQTYAARDAWAGHQIFERVNKDQPPSTPYAPVVSKLEVNVKGDSMHFMSRITKSCDNAQTNAYVPELSCALRDAIFTFDQTIKREVEQKLLQKFNGDVTFDDMWKRNPEWILDRCPR